MSYSAAIDRINELVPDEVTQRLLGVVAAVTHGKAAEAREHVERLADLVDTGEAPELFDDEDSPQHKALCVALSLDER